MLVIYALNRKIPELNRTRTWGGVELMRQKTIAAAPPYPS